MVAVILKWVEWWFIGMIKGTEVRVVPWWFGVDESGWLEEMVLWHKRTGTGRGGMDCGSEGMELLAFL